MKIHPNDDVLEEFVLSLDDPRRSVLRHLAGCGYCRSKLYYLPRPLPIHPKDAAGNPRAGSYEAGLEETRRVLSEWEAVLEKERDEARRGWEPDPSALDALDADSEKRT